MHFVDRSAMFV